MPWRDREPQFVLGAGNDRHPGRYAAQAIGVPLLLQDGLQQCCAELGSVVSCRPSDDRWRHHKLCAERALRLQLSWQQRALAARQGDSQLPGGVRTVAARLLPAVLGWCQPRLSRSQESYGLSHGRSGVPGVPSCAFARDHFQHRLSGVRGQCSAALASRIRQLQFFAAGWILVARGLVQRMAR